MKKKNTKDIPQTQFPADIIMRGIEEEGNIEREAVNTPKKLIQVIAIYLLYLPCLFICITMFFYFASDGFIPMMFGAYLFLGGVGLLSFFMLFKTTINYIKDRNRTKDYS